MKNFKNYKAEKYTNSNFYEVEEGIYKTKDPYDSISNEDIFVTSLLLKWKQNVMVKKIHHLEILHKFHLRSF